MKKHLIILVLLCLSIIINNEKVAAQGCSFSNSKVMVCNLNSLSEFNKIKDKSKIEKLTINSVNLKEIPKDIYKLNNLKYLNLANNQIKEIAKDINKLKKLEVLVLDNNSLANIDNLKLKSLKALHLNGNDLSYIDNNINSLINLEILNLNSNQLTSIASLDKNTKLSKLDLTNNSLITIPSLSALDIINFSIDNNFLSKREIITKNNKYQVSNQDEIKVITNSFKIKDSWYNIETDLKNAIRDSKGAAIVGFEKYTITNISKNAKNYKFNDIFSNSHNLVLEDGKYNAKITLISKTKTYVLDRTILLDISGATDNSGFSGGSNNGGSSGNNGGGNNSGNNNNNNQNNDNPVLVDTDDKLSDNDEKEKKEDNILKQTLESKLGMKSVLFTFLNAYWLQVSLLFGIIALVLIIIFLIVRTRKTAKDASTIIS